MQVIRGWLAWGACLVVALAGAALAQANEPIRPNIVLLFADDLGYNDLSCYGAEFATPHTDTLARDGMKLTSFYVAGPICTPSRFGLLTGRIPYRSHDKLLEALHTDGKQDLDRGIRSDETTVATLLQKAGYRTAIIGKWHLGYAQQKFWPLQHGFDTYYGHIGGCTDFFKFRYGNLPDWYRDNQLLLDETGYATDRLGEAAVAYLKQQDGSQPFFLYVPFNAPHYGKGWDDENKDFLNIMQPKPEDLPRVKNIADELRRDFAAMTISMDDAVGEILKTIDDQGLRDNTLVVFTSDNGGDYNFGGANHPLRGNKGEAFEGGFRVPCLIRWPGKVTPGSVSGEVVSTLDFLPTFCQLAGVDVPDVPLDGKDVTGWLLEGKPLGERRLVWWGRNGQALRDGRWKYIQTHQGDDLLFDIVADPNEKNDLAAQHPDQVRRLRKALHTWLAPYVD